MARDLRDVLSTTLITFKAQCEVRDKIYDTIRKRLRIKEQLEFENFFHKYFDRMNAVELRQHAIVRGYTKDAMRDYNSRALKLCIELMDAHSQEVDLEAKVPSLCTLHEHLTIWLQKFRSAIRMPSTCLVYLAPGEGIGFPSDVDQELDALVGSNEAGRNRGRIIRTLSRGYGES